MWVERALRLSPRGAAHAPSQKDRSEDGACQCIGNADRFRFAGSQPQLSASEVGRDGHAVAPRCPSFSSIGAPFGPGSRFGRTRPAPEPGASTPLGPCGVRFLTRQLTTGLASLRSVGGVPLVLTAGRLGQLPEKPLGRREAAAGDPVAVPGDRRGTSPRSPPPRRSFCSWVRHASAPGPVKGQAPPVAGRRLQAGRVLARSGLRAAPPRLPDPLTVSAAAAGRAAPSPLCFPKGMGLSESIAGRLAHRRNRAKTPPPRCKETRDERHHR